MTKQRIQELKELKNHIPFLKELLLKKLELQQNIPSYADKQIQRAITILETSNKFDLESEAFTAQDQDSFRALIAYNHYHQIGRFQSMAKRHLTILESENFPQGIVSSLTWKKMPLIKTVEDFAIIPLLIQNLRPQTIIEIGSGSGASAVWMADHLMMNEIEGRVYSIDTHELNIKHKAVEFIRGDANELEALLPKTKIECLPHPWLIVDDAHQTIVSVLEYLNSMMQTGDYVYVEDSYKQQEQLGAFMMRQQNSFLVDTFYTDFFGRNSVSAKNSILKKIE